MLLLIALQFSLVLVLCKMMRAGALEAEADEDHDHAANPVPAVVAAPPNAVQARAAAFANAGHPLRVAQRLLSKKRTDIVVSANGDQWVKHTLSRNGAKQYWRCRDHGKPCAVRGWSTVDSTVIQRMDPGVRHNHAQSPAVQARAAAFANAGFPLRVAQRLLSKKRTDIVVSANGDQWVKHKVSRNGEKQYWRCRDHNKPCAVRGWSDVDSTEIQRTDPAVRHNHAQSPAVQAVRCGVT